jgi:hypothetical protein
MNLDKDVIKSAQDGKYTEFSKAIKQELNNKMSNSDIGKSYATDFDRIQQLKQAFAQINKDFTHSPYIKEEE